MADNQKMIYEIRIKGHLDKGRSEWLGGLSVEPQPNGDTILTGEIIDQSALNAILNRLHAMNIKLISVDRIDSEEEVSNNEANAMVDIRQIPVSSCPLCSRRRLSVIHGKKTRGTRDPDSVNCSNCGASFVFSEDGENVRFEMIPSPYAYFEEYYSEWASSEDASQLAEAIRTNSKAALSFLPDAKKYGWNLRIILDSWGDADADVVQLDFSWEGRPESKDEGRKELARIRRLEKEMRQVMGEMRQEMNEIRAQYEGDREDPSSRNAALAPYEHTALVANQILNEMETAKRDIQHRIDEHL